MIILFFLKRKVKSMEDYLRTNDHLLDYLKKSYQEQFQSYHELCKMIEIQIRDLFAKEKYEIDALEDKESQEFTYLEEQRLNFEKEEKRIQNEIEKIKKDEENIDQIVLDQLNQETLLQEEIDQIDNDNKEVLKEIKELRNKKRFLDDQSSKVQKDYQEKLFELKTQFKSYDLARQEQEKYLRDKEEKLDSNYSNFKRRWDQYQLEYQNTKNDLEETIETLRETLNNNNSFDQLERRKTSQLGIQWITEKRKHKEQINKWNQEINKLEVEKKILLNDQQKWIEELKKEHLINTEESKDLIKDLENQLTEKKKNISEVEDKIQEIDQKVKNGRKDLEGSLWKLRNDLANLNKEKVIIYDQYQYSIIELDDLINTYRHQSDNDPFKLEIEKNQKEINKRINGIDKIKKMEKVAVYRNKIYHKKIKERTHQIRQDIKDKNNNLNQIEQQYKNQEERYQEEDIFYQKKIKDLQQEIDDHIKYSESLEIQNQIDTQQALDKFQTESRQIEKSIYQNTTMINNLKNKSNTLLENKDQLLRKKEELDLNGNKIKERMDKRRKSLIKEQQELGQLVIIWQDDFNKYQKNIEELRKEVKKLQMETAVKIQELYQIRGNAEKELKELEREIDISEGKIRDDYRELISRRQKLHHDLLQKVKDLDHDSNE